MKRYGFLLIAAVVALILLSAPVAGSRVLRAPSAVNETLARALAERGDTAATEEHSLDTEMSYVVGSSGVVYLYSATTDTVAVAEHLPLPPAETPTALPTETPTPIPTDTATPTPVPTATPTLTPSPTATTPATATPTRTPTPTPTPGGGPSGQPIPATAPPGWQRALSEDFIYDVPTGRWSGCRSSAPYTCSGLVGTPYYSKWWSYPSPWDDTSDHGIYSPQLVLSVHDGVLDKYIHTTPDGVHRVASLNPQLAQRTNLRITYRYRVPAVIPRYKQAWLLWPDSGVWPRDGEIDFPEANFNSASKIYGFVHRQGATIGSDQYGIGTSLLSVGPWRTVTTEWITGQSVKFYVDGVLVGQTTTRVPNTPMHLVMQTETEVSSTEPADATAGHVLIDWITIDTWVGP